MTLTKMSGAPLLAAVAVIGALVLTPTASAGTGTGTDPNTPYGTNPTTSNARTYHIDNQDEDNTSNGFTDQAF